MKNNIKSGKNVNSSHTSDKDKEDDPNFVDHLRHPLALLIRSLLVREERKSLGQIIIDDEENIVQALKADITIKQIFTTDKEQLTTEFCKSLPPNLPIIDVAKRTGKKIFGNEKTSRVFAIAEMPAPLPLTSLKSVNNDIIVLEELSISGNVGAIIRTSVALGVGGVVLLGAEPVDIYDRRIIRASRGHVFQVPIVTADSQELIQFCNSNAIKLLVTTPHVELSIDEATQANEKLAIILGSEKEGCSAELLNSADLKVKIPMSEEVESLNVSVAASIILYLRSLHHRGYQLKSS